MLFIFEAIGIKSAFWCSNVIWGPRDSLEHKREAWGLQRIPRASNYVRAPTNGRYRYSCIKAC